MQLAEGLLAALSRNAVRVKSDGQAPDSPSRGRGFLWKTGSFPRLLKLGNDVAEAVLGVH